MADGGRDAIARRRARRRSDVREDGDDEGVAPPRSARRDEAASQARQNIQDCSIAELFGEGQRASVTGTYQTCAACVPLRA